MALYALDGLISLLYTIRFEYTDEIGERTKKFCDKFLELERYFDLSITPKSHILEDHACFQQHALQGFGDLDESFGERNHQTEALIDRRYGGTRDYGQKERLKAQARQEAYCPEVVKQTSGDTEQSEKKIVQQLHRNTIQ